MRFLGPELNKHGYSYYANVFGSNGSDDGAMIANVTIVNTNVLDGYSIESPELSITPNFQGTRKVKSADGKVHYEHGLHVAELEDIATNYGKEPTNSDFVHNAFQTFNTKLTIRGVDGARNLVIGNTYVSPWSLMVERSQSIRASLSNLNKIKGENGIAILMGDTNTYGVDTTAKPPFGLPAHPYLTAPAALLRADKGEGEHMDKVAQRLGFVTSENDEPTIKKGPVGMKLDRVMASVGDSTDVHIEAHPVPVSFTDHRILRATITF